MNRAARIFCLLCVVACSQPHDRQSAAPPPVPQPAPPESPKAPAVAGPKLTPVDEASRDASLVAFRTAFLAAIDRRDTQALLAALDPHIRTSFGEGGGIRAFRKQWKPEQRDSRIWTELEQVLKLGGTFQKGGDVPRFWTPYVYSAWPDRQDAFEAYAVIAENVPLHESNDAASKPIATLAYDIVTRVGQDDAGAPMHHVRTSDGREGFVEARFLRSPIGYRAGLVKRADGWKIEALVAGD